MPECSASGQAAKPTNAKKSTAANAKKAKPIPPVTFEAHNEGSVEGPIYGDENLVSLTIDSSGLQYQTKIQDKPVTIKWDDLSGWQANNFTSRSPGNNNLQPAAIMESESISARATPAARTRNGHDYLAAIKALRTLASAKERSRHRLNPRYALSLLHVTDNGWRSLEHTLTEPRPRGSGSPPDTAAP